jgi:hypothetical protein
MALAPTLTPARCVQVGDLLSPDGEYVIDVLPGPGNCVRIITNQTTRRKSEWTPECGLHYGPYVEHRDNRLWTYGTK